jgi:hypothetical protein
MFTMRDPDEYRYENALKWVRTIAGMHYFGQAFEPEHMRGIANIAANALAGKKIKDHDEAMATARAHALELAESLGLDLAGDGDDEDDDGDHDN